MFSQVFKAEKYTYEGLSTTYSTRRAYENDFGFCWVFAYRFWRKKPLSWLFSLLFMNHWTYNRIMLNVDEGVNSIVLKKIEKKRERKEKYEKYFKLAFVIWRHFMDMMLKSSTNWGMHINTVKQEQRKSIQ